MTWVVMYMVGSNDYEAGPYDSFDEAQNERNDIEGYEGVFNVTIVQRGPRNSHASNSPGSKEGGDS